MEDVNIMLPISEHEQSDINLDDAQCNVHDAGADSDTAGLNNSEDDDLDVAARMLSDEVSSTLTFHQHHKSSQTKRLLHLSQTARNLGSLQRCLTLVPTTYLLLIGNEWQRWDLLNLNQFLLITVLDALDSDLGWCWWCCFRVRWKYHYLWWIVDFLWQWRCCKTCLNSCKKECRLTCSNQERQSQTSWSESIDSPGHSSCYLWSQVSCDVCPWVSWISQKKPALNANFVNHGWEMWCGRNQKTSSSRWAVCFTAQCLGELIQLQRLPRIFLIVLNLSEVDACIPIMRHELKDDACTNIDGYFRLGHKDFAKARILMEKLVYIHAMKFNVSPLHFLWLSLIVVPLFQVNNNATPIRNKPYQGELLVLLISNQLFHSSRAIGMKFTSHFVEIAKNKLKHPKIPIPFLALVATAVVYLSLLCKYVAQLFIGLFRSFMEVAWFSREVQLLWKPIQWSLQLPHQVPRTAEAQRT